MIVLEGLKKCSHRKKTLEQLPMEANNKLGTYLVETTTFVKIRVNHDKKVV
jgi:hypothetical protein